MVKINLNELRKYKVLIYCNNYSEEDYVCCCINSDCYYKCGFIENVYTSNGEIIFSVYSAECKSVKLKHMDIKVHMKDIEVYNHVFSKVYNIYEDFTEHEYINIKTSEISKCEEYYYSENIEYRLYKNLDFISLMKILHGLVFPIDNLGSIEMAMLNDPYVLNKIDIPEDYEFGMY